MTEQHYVLQELVKIPEEDNLLKLSILVDGIQYERFFGKPLKQDKGIHSLFSLPEDKILAFAGPWLLDVTELSRDKLAQLILLEGKYPAVSWILSEHPFLTLVRHLETTLMITLPSKEKGLLRFYDCRALKMLSEILTPVQMTQVMKYIYRWYFVSEQKVRCYQNNADVVSMNVLEEYIVIKEG